VSERAKALINTVFPVTDREAPKAERIVFDANSNFGILRSDSSLKYDITPSKASEKAAEAPKPASAASVLKPVSETDNSLSSTVFEAKAEPTAKPTNNIISVPSFGEEKKAAEERKPVIPDYKLIGELFNSYVIVEIGETAYMIDKHAAHERIIFEDLKAITKSATPSSQMLMLPIEVYLTGEELGAIDEWGDEIRKTGFGFEKVGGRVSIYEIPTGIEQSAAADMFITFASKLASGEGDAAFEKDKFFEKALYQASCKAAIKAGRIYDSGHVKWICDKVLSLDNIKYCPHGRPVAFEITKHFLEKQFERIK